MKLDYIRPQDGEISLDEEDTAPLQDKVFYRGSYMIYWKTLILKNILVHGVLNVDLFLDIPIRVKFYDVPLWFWSESLLSKIASTLGKPLYTNQFTYERS
ncbi:hypothetical protein LIER_34615 [Lithospermum erythrorhizon]|uniref:Uncharacterized protein n=1 Tax=Lithospermum erythrorhizon TaxID=34254 RepID=A0AAV3S1E3_LITER